MCQPAENIIWLAFKHAGFQSLKQMESGRCLSLRTMCFSISNIVEKGTSTQGPPLLPLCGFQNLRFFDSGDKPITPLHRLDSLQTVLKDILVLMSHMKQSGMSHQRPGEGGRGGSDSQQQPLRSLRDAFFQFWLLLPSESLTGGLPNC